VLLTPEDILTKDDTWISQRDLFNRYDHIAASLPNDAIRAQLNNYFRSVLPKKQHGKAPKQEEKHAAIVKVLEKYPEIIDWYIRDREDNGADAVRTSLAKVEEVKGLFIEQVRQLQETLQESGFYDIPADSYIACLKRVMYLKQVIENNDGYRVFYDKDDEPIGTEEDLKLMYRLTWFATEFDVNSEVNNGRGPADYKISKGSIDKSLVEFKLASNSKLRQNLENQVEVYKKANETKSAVKVILYFKSSELEKVKAILKDLKLDKDPSIVLIDARKDNKTSASNVKTIGATKNKTEKRIRG